MFQFSRWFAFYKRFVFFQTKHQK